MTDVLQEIINHKRRTIDDLPECQADLPVSDRDFAGSLRGERRAIIAEIKRRSPSGWMVSGEFCPRTIARKYEAGGAAALSVLTDFKHFGGDSAHLIQARNASSGLPLLRKDFILDVRQVDESRRIGADACLLIAAALEVENLRLLKRRIEELGMDAVVEVHNECELEAALAVDPAIIAINNRNLRDLSVDPRTTCRICPRVPDHVVVVSASGFATAEEIQALPSRVDAVLIGTALMRSADPVAFLESLREARSLQP